MKTLNLVLKFLALVGSFAFSSASAKMISTCEPFKNVAAGPYVIQTDYWNNTQCPGVQCVNIDDQTGSFSVTESTSTCPNVSSYPSIVYGKAWGVTSAQTDLPAPLRSLQCVTSDWDFTPTNTGSWDTAYDIWICPDNQCGSASGFNGGAEVMIWMDYRNANGWEHDMGPVTISGKTWELWWMDASSGNTKWKYIAYLAKTPSTSVKNLAVGDFLNDSISRGYLKPDWYLYAVEAGNEMRDQGVPFTSNHFSVSVNKTRGAKTTYVDTTFPPTPTPGHYDDSVPSPP